MSKRIHFMLAVLTALACPGASAQNTVRTETIRPAQPDAPRAPEVITDLSRLPAPVARMRERLLTVARAGDLAALAALMTPGETVFTFTEDKDPVALWKTSYPDSEGLEVLAILINVLEAGFLRIDEGSPQEIWLWPYFVHMPIKTLSPSQKVELFRIVTGSDYKDMVEYGAYAFYRVGIAADGTWRFFVAGD